MTRSRRWRIHDHTRVDASRERTEAVPRRYQSTQASRTSTPAGRRRRRRASPCLPFKGGWKEGAASRASSTSRSSPTVRSRRPGVLWWFHFVDVTRAHLTRSRLVSFSFLGPFGHRDAPRRSNGREGRLPLHRAARRRRAVHDQGDRELLLGLICWVRGLLESGGRGDGVGADRHPPATALAPRLGRRRRSTGAVNCASNIARRKLL